LLPILIVSCCDCFVLPQSYSAQTSLAKCRFLDPVAVATSAQDDGINKRGTNQPGASARTTGSLPNL
jgi:hypothetical protein